MMWAHCNASGTGDVVSSDESLLACGGGARSIGKGIYKLIFSFDCFASLVSFPPF